MKTFHIRVQFVGGESRLIETKEFAFVAHAVREGFKSLMSHGFDAVGFKVLAEWEEEAYQEAAAARVALVDAMTKAVR